MSGVLHVIDTYGGDVCGYSIPAAEHSTITSWGRANEVDAYRNMVKQFGGDGKILAVVSDSYDIYKACEMWGTELKDDVIASGATVVIRPDSGDPTVVLPKMFNILGSRFGFVKNSKGYKVLNNVRVIWGDGIDSISLSEILRTVVDVAGWSADNIAFGMGGGLLQQCNRDTQEFAMKASAVGIREWIHDAAGLLENKIVWRDVFKDPVTASNKASKKGRVQLWTNGAPQGTEYETAVNAPTRWTDKGFGWEDAMYTYFEDGEVGFTQTFEQVRANSMM
jgi:nicotinamide phosphoribosyltransferase